jgi:hypothetical protein
MRTPQPNNGMHPTADTNDFIFGNFVGRRVMPGIRCFLAMNRQKSDVVEQVIYSRRCIGGGYKLSDSSPASSRWQTLPVSH